MSHPHTQAVAWVTVRVPTDAPAGIYRGAVLAEADHGWRSELPVETRGVRFFSSRFLWLHNAHRSRHLPQYRARQQAARFAVPAFERFAARLSFQEQLQRDFRPTADAA